MFVIESSRLSDAIRPGTGLVFSFRARGAVHVERTQIEIAALILTPERKKVEFFWLDERGRFQPLPRTGKGIVRTRVMPGLRIEVNWLWREP